MNHLAQQQRVYKTVGGRDLQLFIVNPPAWNASEKRPALVLFHGGGWKSGVPTQFDELCQHLAARGMVCIQVEYRLLDDAATPPLLCVQDAKSAMRWVRAHAAELGIDPNRIAAGGGSAGGHLAASISMVKGLDDAADDLTISPRAQTLLLFNPVYDNGPGGFGHERVGARYREFSPLHNIRAGAPPTIVFLGTEDNLISVETARQFKAEVENVGTRCDLHLYEGAAHGFFNNPPYLEQTIAQSEAFLRSLGWIESELPVQ